MSVWMGCAVFYSLVLMGCSVDNSRQSHVNSVPESISAQEFTRSVQPSSKVLGATDILDERAQEQVPHLSSQQRARRTSRSHQYAPVQLEVEQMLVARDVKKRRAIGESDVFPSTVGSLWSLASVKAKGSAAQLEMRWWHGQDLVSTNPFVVSEGIRWSEWSQITVKPTDVGAWRVEVFYPKEDQVLRTRHFKIEPPRQRQTQELSYAVQGVKTTQVKTTLQSTSQISNIRTPSINKLEIARSVKRRRPLGVDTRFKVTHERLWGYIEVSNIESPVYVWMEWLHEGEVRSKLRVRVGVSRRWRTWSWQRLTQGDIGDWEVRVSSSQGSVLARTYFTVDL